MTTAQSITHGAMGWEGPPGKPEAWVCRHRGARVLNRQAVCPQCKRSR